MSSILDALKKVERESTPDQRPATPWPAPPPRNRQQNRRWWLPLGIVVGLCALGLIVYQIQPFKNNLPADSVQPAPPVNPPANRARPEAASQAISPLPAAKVTPEPAPATPKDHSLSQNEQPTPDVAVNVSPSMTAAPAASSATRTVPAPTPELTPPLQPPTQTATAQPEADTEGPSPPSRAAAIRTETRGQSETPPPKADKNYRDDPRIELQALVWAPESEARFVIINNRLIKEGGDVDDIVVVRINPDDVVLAEGSDQWVEKFSIR